MPGTVIEVRDIIVVHQNIDSYAPVTSTGISRWLRAQASAALLEEYKQTKPYRTTVMEIPGYHPKHPFHNHVYKYDSAHVPITVQITF